MNLNQPINIVKIYRDTPVSNPGGIVTIVCEKAEAPRPSINIIIERLKEVRFCDHNATFNIEEATP